MGAGLAATEAAFFGADLRGAFFAFETAASTVTSALVFLATGAFDEGASEATAFGGAAFLGADFLAAGLLGAESPAGFEAAFVGVLAAAFGAAFRAAFAAG